MSRATNARSSPATSGSFIAAGCRTPQCRKWRTPVKHHRDAALVGGGDHLVVAHRAAGLDHAGGAGVDHHVEAVAEREEGIARDRRAGERQAGVLGLDAGDARRVDAGSSGRRRRRASCRRRRRRSRCSSRTSRPSRRTAGRCSCSGVGSRFVTIFRSASSSLVVVGGLDQQPRADALDVVRSCGRRRRSRAGSAIRRTRVFALAANTASASGVNDGAISTSTNCFATRLGAAPSSTAALKAMMPPKAEVGSVLQRLGVGLAARGADRHAARVRVLDDHAGRGRRRRRSS